MSDLPAGVYTAYSMATSGKTVALAAFAPQYGDYTRVPRINFLAVSTPKVVTLALPQPGALPSGTAAGYLMSTSGKTVAMGLTGGYYARIYQLVLKLDQSASPSCTVAGNIGVSIALPQPPGCTVAGQIALTFAPLTGVSAVLGTATCTGTISVKFQPTSTNSCAVKGEISVKFLQRAGQQETCISGPDTPAGGKAPNAVY